MSGATGSGGAGGARAWAALSPLERAEAFFGMLREGGNYDESVVNGLSVEAAARGRVVCRLRVGAQHANQYGTLHGACIGTLVDVMGSAVVVTASARCGVALVINTHFLAPGPGQGDIEVEATLVRAGKQIATTEVVLRTLGGAEFARGTHVKALVPASDLAPLWLHTAARAGKASGSGGGSGGSDGSGDSSGGGGGGNGGSGGGASRLPPIRSRL